MSVAFAEGAITHLRWERKVLLSPGEALAIRERLARDLGAVPFGPTHVTAVYFDRPGFPLARRARAARDCLKVRVKEYAPDRDGTGGRVVLEAKRERGAVSSKERVWLPRSCVRAALHGRNGHSLSVRDPLLAPVVATRYERLVFQVAESWRVTLDRDLSFHAAGWEALASDGHAAAARLGPAIGGETAVVLEVKWMGDEVPAWLAALVAERARPFSKFVQAMACVEPCEARGG